jgi:DNA-binding transcriptional MerR regulator
MAEKELLTIRDIAASLGAPESTIRHWRDQFDEFLPSVGQGKRKRYRKTAIEVLRFVQDRLNRNETATEIREALSREYPRNIDTVAEGNRNTATTQPDRNAEGQELATVFVDQLLGRVQGLLSEQNQRLASLEEENRQLRERLARIEEREQTRTAAPQQIAAPAQSREAILSYIRHLREQGKGYAGIASQLNREGIPGFRGGMWHSKTIYKLLKKSS